MDQKRVGFTIDAGLIQRLGYELVGRAETAVSELIKNAYDADARNVNVYFRFSSVRLNRLSNKLLANYLKSGGNELATVRISAFCVAMLSNNSFICKYSIFFRKYELSAAVL